VFNGDKSTEKSDVFSMGIVVWEVIKTLMQCALHFFALSLASFHFLP